MTSNFELDTAVAFVVFNRPNQTTQVLDAIASVRPKRLFVIADGPRAGHPDDHENCRAVRQIVENAEWPCEIRMSLAETNMGARDRTISGTDWVFSQVEEAIFLEDDTVPDPSFFRFCQELLRRYRHDDRIMSIAGASCVQQWPSSYSYWFSALPCAWGRALWRRSWDLFDPTMELWPEVRDNALLSHVFPDRAQAAYWRRIMEATYRGRFDAWDYPFALSCWLQNGLTIVPERNLVRNIGFGPDATNTKSDTASGRPPAGQVAFPLRHPPMILRDRHYDDFAHRKVFHARPLARRMVSRVKALVGRFAPNGAPARL